MDHAPFKIGIIGTGRMASNLGQLWAAQGHQIFFGSRDPAKAQEVAESIDADASGGTQAKAASFGDVILLAVPWTAAEETVDALGPLADKILIDITNPTQTTKTGIQLAIGFDESMAERIAVRAPEAKVIKAFNMIHFRNLDRPQFSPVRASSFFCGDDADAKAIVARLSRDLGFDPVDSGPLLNARLLEPLAVLWMQLAFGGHGTDIAFALLRDREGR